MTLVSKRRSSGDSGFVVAVAALLLVPALSLLNIVTSAFSAAVMFFPTMVVLGMLNDEWSAVPALSGWATFLSLFLIQSVLGGRGVSKSSSS